MLSHYVLPPSFQVLLFAPTYLVGWHTTFSWFFQLTCNERITFTILTFNLSYEHLLLSVRYVGLCHARIIYVHSTSAGMSRACIHLGVHDQHVSNGMSIPPLLECLGLAFILVYMISMYPMVHVVNQWTWHTSTLRMKYWKHPRRKIQT